MRAYEWLLIAVWILVPALVLVKGNRFDSYARTLSRAGAATLLGWMLLIAMRISSVEMDLRRATTEGELQAIATGDGAPNAAVLLFGWIPSLVLVMMIWAAARAWRAIARSPDRR